MGQIKRPKHFAFNKVMIAGQVKYITALELRKGDPEKITIYVQLNDDWVDPFKEELSSIRVNVSGKAAVYVYNNIAPEDTVFIIGSLRFIQHVIEHPYEEDDLMIDERFTYLESDNVRLVEKNQEPIEYPVLRIEEKPLEFDNPGEWYADFWKH